MKKWIIPTIMLILISIIVIMGFEINSKNNEVERVSSNLVNSGFIIDSLRASNGDLYASVNRLHVSEQELSSLNRELQNDIKNLNLKIKNLESASKVEIRYVYLKDSVNVSKKDSLNGDYIAMITDDHIDVGFGLNINTEPPSITDFHLEIKDEITVINEFQTKRKWFLFIPCGYKVIGTKVYIKSDNPYLKINRVESFTFDNKLNNKLRK